MTITTPAPAPDIIIDAIMTLLENGVPTGPIAKAFNMDQTTVKSIQATLRIKVYGASEIAELLQNLMFDAYKQARHMMIYGSPATKQRIIQMILSRAMSLVGKQAPEEFELLRHEMQKMLVEVASSVTGEIPSMYADPTYSPTTIEDDE